VPAVYFTSLNGISYASTRVIFSWTWTCTVTRLVTNNSNIFWGSYFFQLLWSVSFRFPCFFLFLHWLFFVSALIKLATVLLWWLTCVWLPLCQIKSKTWETVRETDIRTKRWMGNGEIDPEVYADWVVCGWGWVSGWMMNWLLEWNIECWSTESINGRKTA